MRKEIIFIVGNNFYFKDNSSSHLQYTSSNEDLQNVYPHLDSLSGRGLFIIGGFDQVASLISHSNINLAHLVDLNTTAIEYSRMRLALTQISEDRIEYIGRLLSRNVGENFQEGFLENSESRYNEKNSQETASQLYEKYDVDEKILHKTILNPGFEKDLKDSGSQVAQRGFWSFLKINKDNWLSSDNLFERVKWMYSKDQFEFSLLNLADPYEDLTSSQP